jgi:hypothetical protein
MKNNVRLAETDLPLRKRERGTAMKLAKAKIARARKLRVCTSLKGWIAVARGEVKRARKPESAESVSVVTPLDTALFALQKTLERSLCLKRKASE